jgi:hypothetical protein
MFARWMTTTMLSAPAMEKLARSESNAMKTVWVRVIIGMVLGLVGLASSLLIWVSGSHHYGVTSRIWQTLGIAGLIAICIAAHGCAAAVLWSLRRTISRTGGRMLALCLAVCTLPVGLFPFVLAVRFVHGD